ncbi:MAG: MFS transporter [Hydrogenophaga sp.]|nr:MFS transporter [Hydrogenophaga sp.]
MNTSFTRGSLAVLTVGHIAGMIDLVALPLWVGTLMQTYRMSPQTAGLTITLFLLAVALTSFVLSAQFTRLPRRAMATVGFLLASGSFYQAAQSPVDADQRATLMVIHAIAGLGIGAGLSMIHGGMGRAQNPHRMFAISNTLLGVFAVGFLGGMPVVIQGSGGHSIFLAFSLIMLLAAVLCLARYPQIDTHVNERQAAIQKIPRRAWFAIAAVIFLTLNYAMIFSFIERVGMERGFGTSMVAGVLLALGLINLVPGPLAAVLENRISAVTVGIVAPVVQALLALTVFNASGFNAYAAAAAFCVFPVMFGHIFLFGLIAKLDPSGRAAASTPAMVMIGSSMGPLLGGTLVQSLGYASVGFAAVIIAGFTISAAVLIKKHDHRAMLSHKIA